MQGAAPATFDARATTKVDRTDWRGVAAIAFAYLLVTGWLSLELNVWRDEMYSLHSSSGSVVRGAWRAIQFELQPPLYFAVLSAWRSIDDSIFFARLLSAIFGAGTILTAATFARRHLPGVRPLHAAAVVATHPFLVWVGTEVRVYGLVVLLSSVMTLAFFDSYWQEEPPLRRRLAFGMLAVLAIHTQCYLALLIVCFGVALVARRRRSGVVAYAIDMTLVAVACVPLAWALERQLGAHEQDLGRRLTLGPEALRLLFGRFEAYVFSFNQAIDQARWSLGVIRVARWAYRGAIVAVLALGFVRLRRIAHPRWGDAWPIAAGLGAYALGMLGLFISVGPMSVGERHTAGIVVPVLLAVMAAPAFVLGRAMAQTWAAFLIASNVAAAAVAEVVPGAKDCDCRRVAETITEHETPGEAILVFPSEDVMPLSVYYHGKNRLIGVPGPPSYDRWDQSTFVIRSADEVARVLDASAPAAPAIWVHTNTYGPSWGPDKLEAFLASGFREDERREFAHGVVLRHFLRDDPAPRMRADP